MTYIDHIAPVRATGPSPCRPIGCFQPGRWGPGWSASDDPFGTTCNHQHPTTPKESE
jgi:hypothetical protein